jgi:hypothetical protein
MHKKTFKQILEEQGIKINLENNPEGQQQLNQKQGDNTNYIERL